MPVVSIKKVAKTQFKKGDVSKTILPIGSERETKDGYIMLKVANPSEWKLKHRCLFENHYKVIIPEGFKCIFIDGNKRNFSVNNLLLESNRVAIRRNTIHRYGPELKSLIRLHSKLIKNISNEERSNS